MKTERGFSLIELMVTISVLAITMTIAVPSFNNIIQNSRSTALANGVVTALNYARSEAIRRNAPVSFCPGAGACPGNWADGWFVRLEAGAETLKVWDAPDAGAVFSAAAMQISFTGQGTISTGAYTVQTHYQGCTGDKARQVRVEASGRVSVRRVNCP